jgi:hypothetical protein
MKVYSKIFDIFVKLFSIFENIFIEESFFNVIIVVIKEK